MEYIIYFISNFILCSAIFRSMCVFLKMKPAHGQIFNNVCLLMCSLTSVSVLLPASSIPPVLRVFIILLAISGKMIFFSLIFGKLNLKVIYVCLLSMVTSSNYDTILTLLIQDKTWRSIAAFLLESAILGAVLMYTKKKDLRDVFYEYIRVLPKKLYAVILIFLYVMNLVIFASIDPKYGDISKVMLLPAFIFMTIIVYWVLKVSISEHENKQVSYILSKQLETQVSYYEKINSIYNEFRSFRHDFKNHLLCLRSLLAENEVENALDYMNDIENMSYTEKKNFDTGNIIADALLNDKNEKAAACNSRITFSGYVPTNGITNTDLCTIMANALDNAIEACAKDTGDELKEIKVESDFKQGYFFFKATNPVFEKVDIKNGNELKTSKEDKSCHGFGVANIVKTAKKYGGSAHASISDNKFILETELLLNREI
ncbi:MAG: GHKL domain-containing protein [Ruminococcus sp.]|nr:GHKL domain-containing protein [Ruminococcus sp.]